MKGRYTRDVGRMDEFFLEHLKRVKKLEIGIGRKRSGWESNEGKFVFGLTGEWIRLANGIQKSGHVPLPFKDIV